MERGGLDSLFNQMVNCKDDPLNVTFAALADPTRRQILSQLSRCPTRVTDLAAPFDMSLPAVSKHLRVLEKAGLLKRERRGREYHFELVSSPMREARDWIEQYRKFWEGSLDALAHYLENTDQPKKGKKS